MSKFISFATALALIAPAAIAVLHQAALIVA